MVRICGAKMFLVTEAKKRRVSLAGFQVQLNALAMLGESYFAFEAIGGPAIVTCADFLRLLMTTGLDRKIRFLASPTPAR